MLFYANLTKSVNEIRKFCLILISCQNRTEQNMKSMFMRWDQIFFSVKWDKIKFLFCEMRQNQIFILWDETESNSHFVRWNEIEFFFMRWDKMRDESSSYEMRSNFHVTGCLILVLQSAYCCCLCVSNLCVREEDSQ